MTFKAHVVAPQQFAAWAQGARGSQLKLDGRTYAELSKPSSYVKPITYGAVAPGLFDAIVANRAAESPVPSMLHNKPVPGSGA
jgi:cytochrome o ubiquinol oxidase subunit 2